MGKFGFVTIVGKPNAGKSTLLNSIMQQKIAITTHRKNTTRNQIKGIYNDDDSQIVFIDTPGFYETKSKLDRNMHQRILDSLKGVDVVLYLIPFWKKIDLEYLETIDLSKSKTKKYAIISQIDKNTNQQEIFEMGKKIDSLNIFDKIIPISSLKGYNIENLISEVKKDLKEDQYLYDRTQSYEFDDKFYISEIIREKILVYLNYEVPHDTFVRVVSLENSKNLLKIEVEVFVDRDSQKIIFIGKDGKNIKRIGESARIELEQYFGKKIFLNIFVKVRKSWKNKESIIKEI